MPEPQKPDPDGGSGYYRHPCIYRYEFDCPNWVWQNGDACGACLAKGRPSKRATNQTFHPSNEVQVPLIEGGHLHYVSMTWKALDQSLSNPLDHPFKTVSQYKARGQAQPALGGRGVRRSYYCL